MLKNFLVVLVLGLQSLIVGQEAHQLVLDAHDQDSVFASASFLRGPIVSQSKIASSAVSINNLDKLREMGITLHPGTEFDSKSKNDPVALDKCAGLVYSTLQKLPAEPVSKLKDLTLYLSNSGRRGMGGGGTIILRCANVEDDELVGVLVHEMGHVEDTGVLNGSFLAGKSGFYDGNTPVYKDDKSSEFYALSFLETKTPRKSAGELDFVTGYAQTDCFEDFAETFNYYMLHGNAFRRLAALNEVLQKKYDFMKSEVFGGQEYGFDDDIEGTLLASRSYDSTLVRYSLEKFLAI